MSIHIICLFVCTLYLILVCVIYQSMVLEQDPFQFVSFSLILRETEIVFGENRVCLPVSEDVSGWLFFFRLNVTWL